MSSSEIRIIKYAKVSAEPVIIAMQEFHELEVATLEILDGCETAETSAADAAEEGLTESEAASQAEAEPAVPMDEAIIQAAQAEAEALLQAARAEAENLRAQAAEEGRKQGYEAGLKQGQDDGLKQGLESAAREMEESLRQAAERANSMIAAAEQEVGQLRAEAEPKIIELVLAISRKIIHDEMEQRPGVVLNLVMDALGRVRDQDRINIHVSSDDYEQLLAARRDLQSLVGAEKSLDVTADPVLEPGGCLIETSFGTVEAGVDVQLEAVRRTLQELLS